MQTPAPVTRGQRVQAFIDMPMPRHPVGTRLDLTKLSPARRAQLTKQLRTAIVRRARQNEDAQRAYYGTTASSRKKLPAFDKRILRGVFSLLASPDSVVVSGHVPRALQGLPAVVHQAVLQGATHQGVNFGYSVLFRKNENGTEVLYACSELLFDESDVESCALSGG